MKLPSRALLINGHNSHTVSLLFGIVATGIFVTVTGVWHPSICLFVFGVGALAGESVA